MSGKINLYPHQVEALEKTKHMNRVGFFLDMGLGKTFVGSEKMVRLGGKINLVICQKSKVDDWFEHFTNVMKCDWVYNLTNKDEFTCFMEHTTDDLGLTIYGVINYDLVFRRSEFKDIHIDTIMLDESSIIQNDKAKRSKFILKMDVENVILLSGTPTSGKYENLWTQLHLLGWGISKNLYNKQYVNWRKIDFGGFTQWIVDKKNPYKNVDRLKQKLREHGAVFMKTEECFELPEQTFIPIKVKPTKEYKKFQKDRIITVEDVELVGDTTLTKRLYERQLCGQYNKEKFEAFRDLVESTNDRLIVFYNFNDELYKLKEIAEELERPISEVNGHVKDLTAYESEDNSITFVQYQAGAKGLNLQKANKIIYFTPTEKCEDWMQSQKRIHRIGQQKPCFYYQLICEKSIEEMIYQALERGVDFTNELFEEV